MIRRIIIGFIIIYFSASAFAKTEIDCIWIKHTNNSYSCVLLDANPQFTFDGESIVVDSKSYKIDDIVSYQFGHSKDASVFDIADDSFHIVFNDNEIEIHNCKWDKANAVFYIFDPNGKAIKSFTQQKTDKPVILNIADLTPGIYLLNASGTTFRFFKK